MDKIKKRLQWIGSNMIYQALAPLSQFVLSFLIITYQSKAAWGEVVAYLLSINLAVMVLNWGQNTYLIRAFGQQPKAMVTLWQTSFLSRSILLGGVLVFLWFWYPNNRIVLLWIIGIYLFRAFDPIVLYQRVYLSAIWIEAFSLLILLGLLWYHRMHIHTALILKLYVLQAWIKAMGYWLLFSTFWSRKWTGTFSKSFLKGALPFFLPAMIGFIQSRMDLYGVAYFLPKAELGAYQIFFKILLLFITISQMILSPFLKNMYRMSIQSLQQLNRKVTLTAIVVLIPALGSLYFILPVVYQISFEWQMYVVGYLMLIPFFGYLVLTHQLIRQGREYQMVGVFALGAAINLCSNYWLIPSYGALGAISSSAIVQVVMWAIFYKLTRVGQVEK